MNKIGLLVIIGVSVISYFFLDYPLAKAIDSIAFSAPVEILSEVVNWVDLAMTGYGFYLYILILFIGIALMFTRRKLLAYVFVITLFVHFGSSITVNVLKMTASDSARRLH